MVTVKGLPSTDQHQLSPQLLRKPSHWPPPLSLALLQSVLKDADGGTPVKLTQITPLVCQNPPMVSHLAQSEATVLQWLTKPYVTWPLPLSQPHSRGPQLTLLQPHQPPGYNSNMQSTLWLRVLLLAISSA